MAKIIELLSIGKFADSLARVSGWTLVGRNVTLHGAEGPFAQLFTNLGGTVDSVDDGVILIMQARRDSGHEFVAARLRLIPRHKGWTAYSLMLVRIAVVAELLDEKGQVSATAIAIASLAELRN